MPPEPNKVLPFRQVPPLVRPGLTLPCGCRVEQHNHHGIIVTYCQRHCSFLFSARPGNQDVFYFVTEEDKP